MSSRAKLVDPSGCGAGLVIGGNDAIGAGSGLEKGGAAKTSGRDGVTPGDELLTKVLQPIVVH